MASLASTAYAVCSTCGGEQNWAASANNFLEGKPINDTPSSLSNAQQNRLRNADFNSSLLKESPGQASKVISNLAVTPAQNSTPVLNIVLNDICASPNPANLSDQVKITAVFGNNSSNSQISATQNNLSISTDLTNMIVFAKIKNSAGTEIGRVNLKRTSGNEYAGIWNANVVSGAYKATIDASESGASKTFNDALEIMVMGSKNTPSNIKAIRKLG
jgi:hypothetical protein